MVSYCQSIIAMQKIGTVKSILDDNFLLIEIPSDTTFDNAKLFVYQEIASLEIEKQVGLQKIFIPKGNIEIVLKQSDIIYLATISTKKIKQKTSSILSKLSGLTDLGFESSFEIIPDPNAPILNEKQSLRIPISIKIGINDFIGIN